MSTIETAVIERRKRSDLPLSRGQKFYLAVLRRGDPDRCFYCHVSLTDENRTLDHYMPLRRGGADALHNIKLACLLCNRRKGDTLPADFMQRHPQVVVEMLEWQVARRAYNMARARLHA